MTLAGYILAGKWKKGIDQGCIRMEENNLGWYVRNSVEAVTEGVRAAEKIEYNDTMNKKEFKQNWMREKKELWKNKRMVSLPEKCLKQQMKKKHGTG